MKIFPIFSYFFSYWDTHNATHINKWGRLDEHVIGIQLWHQLPQTFLSEREREKMCESEERKTKF